MKMQMNQISFKPQNHLFSAPMANSVIAFLLIFIFSLPSISSSDLIHNAKTSNLSKSDIDLLEFPLNLEYLEAEFFLFGAFGFGLDKEAPSIAAGGPPPIGATKANLSSIIHGIVAQFAFQEVGHLRAIKKSVEGFPRPLLNLSSTNFAEIIDEAFDQKLEPPFDPYVNDLNYLITSYLFPYVGLTGYVGTNPKLKSAHAKRLVAGLLGVESAQDAVIRTLLYQRAWELVPPYNITVAEFTGKISVLRNELGGDSVKDEGIVVPAKEGAEGKIKGNVIAGDEYSMAYARSPEEILRIVYSSGSASKPGGLFPNGGGGEIAKSFLKKNT
ncbi:Desiccation-related protein PCC13-62 [Apostasia shenzhenica]|uniref:Desiccation-related protein PCC13-62 n=1 Tax=Apostasia shenzhenica TaxID=1088818 RepID=A0A2I0AQN9_9ASPA|nr:Desiccation-related protein PCC13-62 [Apostasia shenzhenica]